MILLKKQYVSEEKPSLLHPPVELFYRSAVSI